MGTSAITVIQNTNSSFDLAIVYPDGRPKNIAGARIVVTVTDSNGIDVIVKTTDDPTQMLVVSAVKGRARVLFKAADTVNLPLTGPTVAYTYKAVATYANSATDEIVEPSVFELSLGGVTQPAPPTFDNNVLVNENYGGTDALRYVTPGGDPIVGAQIRLYLQSDYVANRLTAPVGVTVTNQFGRWTNPLLVLPGYTYVVTFLQPGMYGPDTRTLIA